MNEPLKTYAGELEGHKPTLVRLGLLTETNGNVTVGSAGGAQESVRDYRYLTLTGPSINVICNKIAETIAKHTAPPRVSTIRGALEARRELKVNSYFYEAAADGSQQRVVRSLVAGQAEPPSGHIACSVLAPVPSQSKRQQWQLGVALAYFRDKYSYAITEKDCDATVVNFGIRYPGASARQRQEFIDQLRMPLHKRRQPEVLQLEDLKPEWARKHARVVFTENPVLAALYSVLQDARLGVYQFGTDQSAIQPAGEQPHHFLVFSQPPTIRVDLPLENRLVDVDFAGILQVLEVIPDYSSKPIQISNPTRPLTLAERQIASVLPLTDDAQFFVMNFLREEGFYIDADPDAIHMLMRRALSGYDATAAAAGAAGGDEEPVVPAHGALTEVATQIFRPYYDGVLAADDPWCYPPVLRRVFKVMREMGIRVARNDGRPYEGNHIYPTAAILEKARSVTRFEQDSLRNMQTGFGTAMHQSHMRPASALLVATRSIAHGRQQQQQLALRLAGREQRGGPRIQELAGEGDDGVRAETVTQL